MGKKKKNDKMMVVGHVEVDKKTLKIIFPEVPKGIMHNVRSFVEDNGGRVRRNAMGGITVTAKNPCCPEETSDLALSIGELNIGLSVDAGTIPSIA